MSTKIQWTDETWGVIVGCTKNSPGCENCYAATAAKSPRLQQFPQYQEVADWNKVVFVESQLLKPLRWKKPTKVFISMSDLCHPQVKNEWLNKIFAIAALCPQHTFQFLTKFPLKMQRYLTAENTAAEINQAALQINPAFIPVTLPLPNVWIGVSCENQHCADWRIPLLLQTPATVHFLSCEPLLESLDLSNYLPIEWSELAGDWIESHPGATAYKQKLHWILCGGESGNKTEARPCHIDWIRSIANQCQTAKVPVFVKQLGTNPIDSTPYIEGVANNHFHVKLKDRKGGDISEFPDDLQIRQFPKNSVHQT